MNEPKPNTKPDNMYRQPNFELPSMEIRRCNYFGCGWEGPYGQSRAEVFWCPKCKKTAPMIHCVPFLTRPASEGSGEAEAVEILNGWMQWTPAQGVPEYDQRWVNKLAAAAERVASLTRENAHLCKELAQEIENRDRNAEYCEEARKEVADLTRQLAEERGRLDWLEKEAPDGMLSWTTDGTRNCKEITIINGICLSRVLPTLRAAIAAALAQSGGEKEGQALSYQCGYCWHEFTREPHPAGEEHSHETNCPKCGTLAQLKPSQPDEQGR
jgi:hypothetical protein